MRSHFLDMMANGRIQQRIGNLIQVDQVWARLKTWVVVKLVYQPLCWAGCSEQLVSSKPDFMLCVYLLPQNKIWKTLLYKHFPIHWCHPIVRWYICNPTSFDLIIKWYTPGKVESRILYNWISCILSLNENLVGPCDRVCGLVDSGLQTHRQSFPPKSRWWSMTTGHVTRSTLARHSPPMTNPNLSRNLRITHSLWVIMPSAWEQEQERHQYHTTKT